MLQALMGAAPGIMSAAGGLYNLFGTDYDRPQKAAGKYLDKVSGAMDPYYRPYINSGQDALKTLQGQYGTLLNNPNALYSQFGAGYKESPGYQFKLNQALQSGTNAAAAGGMAGSPMHQQQSMQIGNDIASQDFNDYMSHIMNLYGMGLSGTEGLNAQGFDASTSYGNAMGNIQQQKAGMAYETENARNRGRQQAINSIFGGLGGAAGGYTNYLGGLPKG